MSHASLPPCLDPLLADDTIARAQRDLDTMVDACEFRDRIRRMIIRGQLSRPLETTLFESEDQVFGRLPGADRVRPEEAPGLRRPTPAGAPEEPALSLLDVPEEV